MIKPNEADSEVIRENVNEWYRSTLASRLNDKQSGAIIAVMQRLHQFDLPGMLLEAGGWDHLNLPVIAAADETICLLGGKRHRRRAGDLLHSDRESEAALEAIRREMGSHRFAAQYLQNPVPAEGNLIKAVWLKVYTEPLDLCYGYIIQSWDTGNKTGRNSAYSCCITALVRGNDIYILHVLRKRMEFPELRSAVIELAREYNARDLLIEDMASGQQLIQELSALSPRGVPVPIPEKPTSDKETRVSGISAMIEAGQLILPREAPWLPDFKSELLGFPHTRYRDQVDALSQLLARIRSRRQVQPTLIVGPEVGYENEYGRFKFISPDDMLDSWFTSPIDDPWGG